MRSELDWEWAMYVGAGLLPFLLPALWPLVAIPWVLWVAYFVYTQWWSPKFLPAPDRVVFITGCDSGFGLSLARDLDAAGCVVFAGCLFPQGDGANSLRADCSKRVHILDLDVTKAEKVSACKDAVGDYLQTNHIQGLWGLVNNAGISMGGEVEWMLEEDYRRAMEVNLFGTLAVTKALLPFIRHAKGRVVTLTSGIARCAMPGRSGYCVSKYALEGFVDCLRYEMLKFGVHVATVSPGNLAGSTQIFAGMERCLERQYAGMDAGTRAEYGDAYLAAFKDGLVGKGGYRGKGSAAPIQPVVDDLRHALLAESPRVRYKAAQWTWFIWWFLYNLLPEDITDLYFRFALRNMPKPARS